MFTVEKDFNLKNYTTFRIDCIADTVYIPETINDFVEIIKQEPNAYIIGAGSNLIVSSNGIKKPVVLTKNLNSTKIIEDIIEVECGVKTAALSKKMLDENLSGMEFLCCIPASIGGVVTMNASAHKQAIEDIIISAKVFNLTTHKIEELSKEELKLDYRKTIIEGNYIVLSAKFKLEKAEYNSISKKMEHNKNYRETNHPPMKIPNAGSIFKNPEGEIAGRLVDSQGLKGACTGGACVSDIHANFIVNNNNAKSLDILNLMLEIKLKVLENTGYNLKPEVKYIGDKTDIANITQNEQEIWKKLNN